MSAPASIRIVGAREHNLKGFDVDVPVGRLTVVTGTPSKKAQGTPPDEKDVKNYHLFLREPILTSPGLVLRLTLKQMEMAKATYAPDKKGGLAEQ